MTTPNATGTYYHVSLSRDGFMTDGRPVGMFRTPVVPKAGQDAKGDAVQAMAASLGVSVRKLMVVKAFTVVNGKRY